MHDVLIVLAIFSAISFIIYTITGALRQGATARAAAQLHSKVLDKCAASQDLIVYLESSVGRKFLDSVAVESANPTGRILNAIQAGLVIALIGGAELLIRSGSFDLDTDRFLLVSGAIALAIGIGFLISSAVSFSLCKSWGLVPPRTTTTIE